MTFLLDILTTIMVAVISAWIAVQFSLRRFRTEKWWEKRVFAYERLIEAFHHSKAFSESHLKAAQQGREISEERDKELRLKAVEAEREITKAVDLGGFLLGKEARARLTQYISDRRRASDSNSWDEYLLCDLDATDSCLRDLIAIARRDLRTGRDA